MKVTILGVDTERDEAISFIRAKLERVRDRFKLDGSDIDVWLRDTNGPRGGIDQECSIRVTRARQMPVVVKCRHSSVRSAVLGAICRLRRAIAR
ncbi:MAG: hypothetical protein ACK5GN_04245 [Pseudomonadota bacterium]|jgi:putative sigma-54 modulation protein